MEFILADCSNVYFNVERILDEQRGAQNLPFPSMDKSGCAVCTFYLQGLCMRGSLCPYRHIRATTLTVCKHWLRGLCKKGDECEFLHEYDSARMPECYFFQKFGECANKECPFKHTDPSKKIRACPWYDRGFCRHGPFCKNKHVRATICQNYLTGFCPEGSQCKQMHPRWELPVDPVRNELKQRVHCHFCGEQGHKIYTCNKASDEIKAQYVREKQERMDQMQAQQKEQQAELREQMDRSRGYDKDSHGSRPLEEVLCFKCGEMGHYANRCPKGHLAFLHNSKFQKK